MDNDNTLDEKELNVISFDVRLTLGYISLAFKGGGTGTFGYNHRG